MKAKSLLRSAAEAINDREQVYGDRNAVYERAAIIANTTLNLALSTYEIMMILHAVKLARIGGREDIPDNYLDGVNYLAFACEAKFGPREATAEEVIDDGAAEIAQKYAPLTYTEEEVRKYHDAIVGRAE
jgi:hypothetical protein